MISAKDGEKIEADFNSGEASGSHLDDSLQQQTTMTALGKTKTFAGLEKQEWIFITISTVNIMLAIIFTIIAMTYVKDNSPDFTFAIIVIINAAFCIFYAIHGVLREREFELYAYIAAIAVVFVYLVINLIVTVTHPINKDTYFYIKLARIIAVVLLAPINGYYGIKVAREFGYLEFRTVGAAVPLQKMYRKAGVFSCLLKFDYQLALSLAVLVIYNPQNLENSDKIIVGIGVPFQFLWSVLGWCTMRKEQKIPAIVFIAMSFVEPAYIIYWFYRVISDWESLTEDNGRSVLVHSFVVVATLALLIRVFVIIALKFVVDNFGKGLRESVYNIPESEELQLLARKRNTTKCCGIVCCGPLG